MADYTLGTPVRVIATWKVDGVLTDPTAVILRYRHSTKPETVDTFGEPGSIVVKDSAGTFYADIDPDEPGTWLFRWEGTGPAKGATEGSFTVKSIFS
jgi:hypothetical protein